MKTRWKKLAAIAATCVMASTTAVGFAGCGNKDVAEADHVSYRSYTTVMPSNWNELNYSDNNDTQILDYIVSPFFEYDYEFDESKGGKFKADGSINADAIVPGAFTVKYSAATKLEDVTATVDAKWGYTAAQKSAGGYAYKITLRDDLEWDDGTKIVAKDFVYTMQQQLDPDFMLMRASTYYNNITIKNARNYLYGGHYAYGDNMISEDYGDDEYVSLDDFTVEEDGTLSFDGKGIVININGGGNWGQNGLNKYYEVYGAEVFGDAWESVVAKADTTGLVRLTKDDVLIICDMIAVLHDFDDAEAYAAVAGDYAYLEWEEFCYFGVVYDRVDFSTVGIYSPSKYELVICLDNPIQCLKEDGSLSYEAAYSFSGLPLVKEKLYEKCKQKPQAGSTLWTTTYNTSLETTASWGPYKLSAFQSGKEFTLVRNNNWYGYDLADNAGQYKVTRLITELIPGTETQWTKFFAGETDDVGLDVTHADNYRSSKYTYFAPGTGTFGINLYSGLNGLKASGHNSGLLAIDDFRKAISLWLDRDEYNTTLYTAHQSCYGLLGPSYYYDVENGGVYRDTEYAKKGLLRVYGFTENDNGSWTDGTRTYATYEEAYEAMNGMNRTLAKELVEKAYTELTTNAEYYGYDSNKKITLVYGTSADSDGSRRSFNYLVKMVEELTANTSLAGKIELTFDASFGENWANDFKAGAYEIAAGTGFSGGAFDPEGFLQCYLDPEAGLMYATWWDTESEMLEYTMPTGDYAEAGKKYTMSLYNWYCCLNGIAESRGQSYTFNWGAGAIPEEARMQLLSKLEEVTLNKYYTVITTSQYSASLLGAKFTYISDEYNTFMGFGGLRYIIANYNDVEWAAFMSTQGNLEEYYKAVN